MTLHGAQLLSPKHRLTPITYYHKGGAIADVFEVMISPRRIAVIGLGSGVMASFVKKEDAITFYEIDPDNLRDRPIMFYLLGRMPGENRPGCRRRTAIPPKRD